MTALLDAGADIEAHDENRKTPIHYATDAESMATLLKAGADPTAPNLFGYTPRHSSAYRGDAETVNTLLDFGMDPAARIYNGMTPFEVARENEDALAGTKAYGRLLEAAALICEA